MIDLWCHVLEMALSPHSLYSVHTYAVCAHNVRSRQSVTSVDVMLTHGLRMLHSQCLYIGCVLSLLLINLSAARIPLWRAVTMECLNRVCVCRFTLQLGGNWTVPLITCSAHSQMRASVEPLQPGVKGQPLWKVAAAVTPSLIPPLTPRGQQHPRRLRRGTTLPKSISESC